MYLCVVADVLYDCSMNDRHHAGIDDKETVAKGTDPSARRQPDAGRPDTSEPMLYCPVCSRRLIARKCKLICDACGYYMSCADYY
jgi:hypothetical protein